MRIAVTDLTRMQRGYICAAGVDVDTGAHVRPILANGRLRDQLCGRRGGPFDMATVVDLGLVRPVPTPPEVEDHEFTPWHARAVQSIEPKLFWEMLGFLAKPSLSELFGPALRQVGWDRAIVTVGSGSASLGCLAPAGQPRLEVQERSDRAPSIRMRVSDGDMSLNLSVTDLRLWEQDHATPRWDAIENVEDRFRRGVACLLSVGLTRPFAGRDDQDPVHWLQVNSIHLADNPSWRLRNEILAARHHAPDAPGTTVPRTSRPASTPEDFGGLDDLPF